MHFGGWITPVAGWRSFRAMANQCNAEDAGSVRRLRRAFPNFYETHRNILGSKDAFRKRLERRHLNGLAECGAVVETAIGLMIDPPRFRAWLLEPSQQAA